MEKRKSKWITWIYVAVAVLVVVLMLGHTLRRTVHIVLPAVQSDAASDWDNTHSERDALSIIQVSPETVQSAIATLSRPEHYCRIVELEQFWAEGSGTWSITVFVKDGWSRADRTMPDGRVRHTVTDGIVTYVWYNHESQVFSAPAGTITADNDQNIPAYEDILELEPEEIALADHRIYEGVSCIYVETVENRQGYAMHYWVSLENGLLIAAEKLEHGSVVYTMTALTLDPDLPTEDDFTLPDGTVLTSQP